MSARRPRSPPSPGDVLFYLFPRMPVPSLFVESPHPKAVALPPSLPSPGRMMGPKGSTGKEVGGRWGAHLVGFWVFRCGVVVCVCRLGDPS